MHTAREVHTIRAFAPEIVTGLLRAGYPVRLVVTGRSMHPTIRHGEAVLVAPVNVQSLRFGDVVLYVRNNRLWAHRVIRRRMVSGVWILVTQGDGACRPDPPIAASRVVGRVVAVERSGRWHRLDTRGRRYWGLIRYSIRRWRCRLGFCRWCPHFA